MRDTVYQYEEKRGGLHFPSSRLRAISVTLTLSWAFETDEVT